MNFSSPSLNFWNISTFLASFKEEEMKLHQTFIEAKNTLYFDNGRHK